MRSWTPKRALPERLSYSLLAGFSLLAAVLVGWTGYATRINQNFYDLFFRQRGPRPPADQIVIVAIDDATLAEYGSLPLSRSLLARGIERIRQAEPRLVAVDLLLAEASAPPADHDLERALAGHQTGDAGKPDIRQPHGSAPVVLSTALAAGSAARWLDPLPQFAQRAVAVGHVHADPDSDGVSRQVLLAKQAHQQRYWAFALECFRVARTQLRQPITETDAALEIPLDQMPPGAVRVPATAGRQRSLHVAQIAQNLGDQCLGLRLIDG